MKSLFLSLLLTMTFAHVSYAQTPGYYLIYGNRDGSTVDVNINSDIEIKVWAATPAIGSGYEDLDRDGIVDSILFIHAPLASNDDYITSRDEGEFYFPLNQWDDASFLPPDSISNPPGYTNQSILGFADIVGPYNTLLNTDGDTVLIAVFFMHTTSDSGYLNQLVCPFTEGFNPANGGLLWGMQDCQTPIYAEQTFSCLYFVDYIAGDANSSGNIDGLDVTYLVTYFKGFGPPPDPFLGGDANGDCIVNGMDVVYLVAYLKGGPEPFLGSCH